ncbi:uncharacterized protein LOC122498216 [Leptopilina heterotoma]|uniref:uncharacterized protein LOC122498216 n=1 Tax=Leptopilina heterotoma TaxID=63436 RepID=UPI001CA866F5|nr:uncharacterized protein LOC122498216 [Leptopilina heterotoma]
MSVLLFALRLTCCCFLACIVFHPSCGLPDQEQVHYLQHHHRRIINNNGNNDASSLLSGILADVNVYENNNDDHDDDDEVDENILTGNITAENGKYLGSPCNVTCNPLLQHVFCDSITHRCECEKLYPVRLGPSKGCAKPKKLGEQCFYRASCTFADQHSTCTQVQHNAVCDCEEGYHRVALSRPNKKVFCAEDLVLIKTDFPTLLGIAAGLAVFTFLICFVLKLFSSTRYTRPRHFANANHAPPMLFSSDTGDALHGERPSSQSSQRSSGGTLNFTRRPSSAGSRGPLVPASRAGAARAAAILLISCHRPTTKGGNNKHRRALSDVAEGSSDGLGSRRPSLASLHSTGSSARSFSARRLERERNEKEQRQAIQELRLTKQREQQQQQQQQQIAPTPSPRTPHSTDELLPSVEEGKELFYNEQIPTTSGTSGTASTTTRTASIAVREITSATIPPLFDNEVAICMSNDIFQ